MDSATSSMDSLLLEDSWTRLAAISQKAMLPKLPFLPEEKEVEDYGNYFKSGQVASNTTSTFRQILKLLQDEGEIDFKNSLINSSKCWPYLFILIGENCGGFQPWTSATILDLIGSIEKETKRILRPHCKTSSAPREMEVLESVAEFFSYEFLSEVPIMKSTYGNILKVFRRKFKKDDLKYYPAALFSFKKLLYCVQYPNLLAYMDEILPLSLLIVDDYYDENKLLGLQCLSYSIKNLNRAELLRNNWADVLYAAVLRTLTGKDPKIINEAFCILLELLKILEGERINCITLSKYDETLKQIIFTLEFCSEGKLRTIWMPHVIELLTLMGHGTLRWIDRIGQMLLDFTASSDPELWEWILKCTDVCIKNSWVKPKSDMFAEIVLRIVFNASVFDTKLFTNDSYTEMYTLAKNCLLLLRNCEDYNLVNIQIEDILNSNSKLHPKFLYMLKIICNK